MPKSGDSFNSGNSGAGLLCAFFALDIILVYSGTGDIFYNSGTGDIFYIILVQGTYSYLSCMKRIMKFNDIVIDGVAYCLRKSNLV